MALTSRQELIDYSLRRLGFPVIEINVDDDQVSDRIDDAIQFWQEYHFDGTHPAFVKKQITASTQLVSSQSGTFSANALVGYDFNFPVIQTTPVTAFFSLILLFQLNGSVVL